jgi:AcrR family transcriptional regulator
MMARIVKEKQYEARRNEILDAAIRLVYAKGYDQMTIQDILNELEISKGAFYHYFDSKAEVLQAMIERMVDEQVEPVLRAVVDNPNLSAMEKLQGYFDTAIRWKSQRKELMLAITRMYYADENAIFRQKLFSFAQKKITPLLGDVIRQGVREGVFNSEHPDQAGQILVYIMQGLSDNLVELLLQADHLTREDERVVRTITRYRDALTDAVERLLGAPNGSIHIFDPEQVKEWFPSAKEAAGVAGQVEVA